MALPIQIPPPQPVSMSGNVLENWKYFKSSWLNYSIATELNKKDETIKVATLLSVIGKEAFLIYQHLDISDEDRLKSDNIIEALSAHFEPCVNVIYERSVFNEASQEQNESIEQYICRLRKLASTCNYQNMLEELIRDRLVLGIRDRNTKKQLISDAQLTLQKAVDICKSNESANRHVDSLATKNEEIEDVNKMHKSKYKREKLGSNKNENKVKSEFKCKYCAEKHEYNRDKCPAFNKICRNCGKRNHFSKVCKNKKYVKELQVQDSCESDESCNHVENIFKLANSKKLITNLIFELNSIKKKFKCQMDTGATVNVMSYRDLGYLCENPQRYIKRSKTKLKCFGGEILKPIGEIIIKCWRNSKPYPLNFQIVRQADNPLLSAEACQRLDLLEIKADLKKVSSILPFSDEPLINKYKDIFDGLGCLEGEYSLETKPEITPVKQPPRRVPIPLRKELKLKLEDMERKKIICKVTHPTEWISNLVLVKTPNKLRICLDPQNLNQALKRSEYPIPTIEEVMPLLTNAKLFSVVDTKDGFWNVKLSKESTDLTTFWTPFGRYKFLRLPFGLCTATEEYQRRLHEIFDGLSGVIIIADDILIVGRGKTDEEAKKDHDRNLENLFMRAKKNNVKFNKNKIKLRQKEIKYLAHIFTSKGIKPDPEKVKAIINMPRPKDDHEIKSFLGFITYLSKFLPQLSSVSEPLRKLIKKDEVWRWTDDQENAFQKLKKLVVEAPILGYYDPNKEITIQCDASKAGLGAVLMQEGKPITYASRSLNKTEQQYAQIEKECLAIVFSCERFHQFIGGKNEVRVETDHKPLEVIFKKELLKAPKRLQRMLLRLQSYNLNVVFKKGEKMYIADILSRASLPDISQEELSQKIYQVDSIYSELSEIRAQEILNISDTTYENVKVETNKDPILMELKRVVLNGWPSEKNEISPLIMEYWLFREDVTVQDGIIFKSDRIIVPKSLRSEMIRKVHQGHLGINASIRIAKDTLFWPRMSSELKDVIQNCEICNLNQSYLPKEPMQTHKIPELPWERVSSDIFEIKNNYFLILVDHYSDFFEIEKLPDITSKTVIKKCKQHFSRHGIPKILITDNSKQFRSLEFVEFAKKWNFKHSTSTPYHSQGNGKAESAVKIAKNILKKSIQNKEDYWLNVLNWRNTPTVNMNSSPVQRLMSRRTRSLLPVTDKLLKSEIQVSISEKIAAKRQDAKRYYDKKTKPLPQLEIGKEVYVQTPPNMSKEAEKWKKGYIVGTHNSRSYDVNTEGAVIRRNRSWLKESMTSRDEKSSKIPKDKEDDKKLTDIETKLNINDDGKESEPEEEKSESKASPVRTRCGRIVKTPKRFPE